jgi:hypothetical protein
VAHPRMNFCDFQPNLMSCRQQLSDGYSKIGCGTRLQSLHWRVGRSLYALSQIVVHAFVMAFKLFCLPRSRSRKRCVPVLADLVLLLSCRQMHAAGPNHLRISVGFDHPDRESGRQMLAHGTITVFQSGRPIHVHHYFC